MSKIAFCPYCGDILFTEYYNKCTYCNATDITETNIEYRYVEWVKNNKQIKQQIETQYKIKENPLYNEEAVQHRLQEEQKEHDKFYNGKSHNYTTAAPNVPKCPTCQSTNIKKISVGSKAVGFATVGVFSSNFGKTMVCNNCGYKW